MSRGLDSSWQAALEASGIRTHWLVRLDFASATSRIWTGVTGLAVSGTGDIALDGGTFDPVADGVLIDVGENHMTDQGSEEMVFTVSLPSSPDAQIAAASIYASEYMARRAYVWRSLMLTEPMPGIEAVWGFRRIRLARMDSVTTGNTGDLRTFKLTLESHASRMSQASNQSYLDQRRYDPNDTSQDYARSLYNDRNQPTADTKNSSASYSSPTSYSYYRR